MSKPKMTEPAGKLIVAKNDLQGAQCAYDAATREIDAARRIQTDCLNKLNQAQKSVDGLMADIRKSGSGDWESQRRQRHVETKLEGAE